MKPLGVILAGGAARRMGGGDKCLLNLGGETLLARIQARLGPQVSGIVLNANGDPARFPGFEVVADTVAGRPGPLAGILAGMEAGAAVGATHVVTVAGDTPFFPRDLVARLSLAEGPIAMAASGGGRHPTVALWPVALRADLAAALGAGVRKVVAWADPHGVSRVEWTVGADGDPFFNLNTPEDLAAAEARLLEAGA